MGAMVDHKTFYLQLKATLPEEYVGDRNSQPYARLRELLKSPDRLHRLAKEMSERSLVRIEDCEARGLLQPVAGGGVGYNYAGAVETEAEQKLRSRREKYSDGGRKGTRNRSNTAALVRKGVREEAIGIWKAHPSQPQHYVAGVIQKKWLTIFIEEGEEEIKANTPELTTILKYIKGMVSPEKQAKRTARKKT